MSITPVIAWAFARTKETQNCRRDIEFKVANLARCSGVYLKVPTAQNSKGQDHLSPGVFL